MLARGWQPAAVLISVVAVAAAAAPSSATTLQPSGKWVVSGEEGLCVLARSYGTGADEIQLALRPLGSEQRVELVIIGDRDGGSRRWGQGRVVFDDGAAIAGPYNSYLFDHPAQRVTTLTIPRDLRPLVAAATTMTIDAGLTSVTVRLASVAPALKALAQCEDLLLRHWGVDIVAYHAERSHSVGVDLAGSFGPDSYPVEAMRSNAQGRTVALLSVAAAGRVGDCRVVMSAGNALLDKRTCAVARQRMRFTPAIGPEGLAVTSVYVLTVRWQLPTD